MRDFVGKMYPAVGTALFGMNPEDALEVLELRKFSFLIPKSISALWET